MKKAALYAVIMLITGSTHAQGKMRKADANLIANLNAIVDGIDKTMDTEASRINFSRWDASVGLIDSSKTMYEAQKASVGAIHYAISKIKSSGMASAIQLFTIYSNFRNVEESLGGFETSANDSQHDLDLAADLTNLHTKLINQETALRDSVQRLMLQDSNELEKCSGKSYWEGVEAKLVAKGPSPVRF
jgi:hypothetical protein